MPVNLDRECGPRCRSHQHALEINAAITKGGLKEFKAYTSLCYNATNVNDKFGRNVLHMAASCGKLDIIEYLLEEKEYNLKAKDYESGWTALHRALFYGQLAAARLLIQYKHDIRTRDFEGLSPLDIILIDRPNYISYSPREPNEVYTWGDNSNFNLGHSSQDRRIIPERVGVFKRISGFIIQVVMCKFHTVFLSHIGQVYSCGHGHGGRLGHSDQQTHVVPKLIEGIKKENCIQVAAAQDHTLFLTDKGIVYGCGSNTNHQLCFTDPALEVSFTPKMITSEVLKGYSIIGICAGRYHSVVYSRDAVFTFGLNAGQLGHKRGDKYQIHPRMISSFNESDINIVQVKCSDSTTVCLTSLGDIYSCSRYTCRKIGSRWLDIKTITVSGGTLDHLITTDRDLLKEKGGSEIIVAMLTTKGVVYMWREKSPHFKRCNWMIRRELSICDVYLNTNNMGIVTDNGEGFMGIWSPVTKDKRKQKAANKSKQVNDEFPSIRLLDLLLKNDVEDIQIERIPNIHRATNIVSDSKGRNFAAQQVLPNGCLTEIPYIRESSLRKDIKCLFDDGCESDLIHDVVIQCGNRRWAAHKYILASRSEKLNKMIQDTLSDNSNEQTPVFDLSDIHPVIIEELLLFIYTDTCTALTIDSHFQLETNCDNTIDNNPKLEYMTKTQRKKYYRRLHKENSEKEEEREVKTAVNILQDTAEDFGIYDLVERLDCVKMVNDVIYSNGKPLAKPKLKFNRTDHPDLYDVCIKSDDNTIVECHKCILVARMEYFYSMLATGWIETSNSTGLSLPIPGKILNILIDYIYTDDVPQITDTMNVDLLCNILVLADKLLIERLKELSEVAIVNSLNFWNVADLLKFSLIYNAHQLYLSCQQFICLNLPVFLESRLLNNLDEEELEKLTVYYRQLIPAMDQRYITPYSCGPSREYLQYLSQHYSEETNTVLCDVTPRKARNRTKSDSDNKKSRDRQISICSDISIQSEDNNVVMEDITNKNNSACEESIVCNETVDDMVNGDIPDIPEDISSQSNDYLNTSLPDDPTDINGQAESTSLRDIMKSEKSHDKQNKKSTPSGKKKVSWKEAKKIQKQRETEEQQQRAAENRKKKEPKETKEVACPWAGVNKMVKSFRDLMIEEEKTPITKSASSKSPSSKLPTAKSSTSPTSPEVIVSRKHRLSLSSPEPDSYNDMISSSPHQDVSLSSWVTLPKKSKPKIVSPPVYKEPINPWQKLPPISPTSPVLTDNSFIDIVKDEKHREIASEKIRKKPFKLVQIEERAIQELLDHYKVNTTFDEYITVERVPRQTASPLWIKEKPKPKSTIW